MIQPSSREDGDGRALAATSTIVTKATATVVPNKNEKMSSCCDVLLNRGRNEMRVVVSKPQD